MSYNSPVISDTPTLAAFCERISSSSFVALDTEADSLHAYPEKLCLMQVAIDGELALLDPLAGMDLSGLWSVFSSPRLILHGADYDLRLMHRTAGFVPREVFDTMIAARLLGFREFGLVVLLERIFGIKLEKGSQKANWAVRPLTPRMHEYALNDVRHLHSLSQYLESELASRGRKSWIEESCQKLIQVCVTPTAEDPDQVWRVKGCHRLSRHGMAVLRALWGWREDEARRTGRPPFFILGHEQMIAISAAAVDPTRGDAVSKALPSRWSPGKTARCKAAINRGFEEPVDRWPDYPKRTSTRWSDAERVRFEKLQKRRDEIAAGLDIDPTLIASRSVLVQLATDWDQHASELMNWQRELLGSRP